MARQTLCLVLMIVFLGSTSSQVLNDLEECKNAEGRLALISCIDSIAKDLPEQSPADFCCKAIQFVGMKCICSSITKEVENVYDMNKVVKVVSICGKPLAPGSQCGTYKVPGV